MSFTVIEKFEGTLITKEMLSSAATLFSLNYGVWGPLAVEKMGSFAKQGTQMFFILQ
jgi:hypothetical protein